MISLKCNELIIHSKFPACFSAAGFTFGTVPGAVIAATPALGIDEN